MKKHSKAFIKSFEKQLINALTQICEQHKTANNGFIWLTHLVNLHDIEASLKVVCVFENQQQILAAEQSQQTHTMQQQITSAVASLGVNVKNPGKLVRFATEENSQSLI